MDREAGSRCSGRAAGGARRAVAPPTVPALEHRLNEHLRESRLIRPGATVLVAVSGGADSVVLLHLLRFALPAWRLRLIAGHFDHRMREGSADDAAWVAGLCRAWDVPLVRGSATEPLRTEDDARRARYAFLRDAARQADAEVIATAHHADDQVETVLFRILRGTGIEGLAGIPERRGNVVRPLLPFRRAEILAYADEVGLRYRIDPTNLQGGFTRNRLRLEALPLLESIVPGASRAIERLASAARADREAWDAVLERLEDEAVVAQTPETIELARPVLLGYHPGVLARLYRRILRRIGIQPGKGGTRAAVEFTISGGSGAGVEVGRGVLLERDFDRVRITRVRAPAGPGANRPVRIEEAGSGEGVAVIGGRSVAVRWDVNDSSTPEATVELPLAALRFPLEVREWRPGDRMKFRYGTKKLKKLFVERRMGREERRRAPVLAEVGGRVLWVEGIGTAAVPSPEPGHPRLQIVVRDAEHV